MSYSTNFRTERILLINAVSQQYIFTIRIELMISDMVFTRSSVTRKILVLKTQESNVLKVKLEKINLHTVDKQTNDQRMFE